MAYNFKEIEKKWQDKWEKEGTFNAKNDYTMKKWYGLIEFPYPSGQGLHVGHPRSFTALDIVARKRRLQGYNVLYPIGFDAFGLPAENYAIKTNVHPKITTAQNIAHFTEQLKSLGISFDWSRKIDTTDPNYYKWTQWIFIQLYKHGLAYKATMPINFCTSCKVGLANEEVVNGVCERCGSPVIQKEKSEWMLKITNYAQRLIDDLDDVDFLEKIKTQQKNWIGRSEGAEVDFNISGTDKKLKVYTTRPDTLFGATYMVISPEHPILDDSELFHAMSGKSFASAGWTGTQLTVDPINQIYLFMAGNRSHNRMTFIDPSQRDKIETLDSGKKIITLPDGSVKTDATRFAWDKSEVVINPVLNLVIQYKMLEDFYIAFNEKIESKENTKIIEKTK